MDVGVVVCVEITYSIEDNCRFLGSCRRIEVNERLFMDLLVQNREIPAYAVRQPSCARRSYCHVLHNRNMYMLSGGRD